MVREGTHCAHIPHVISRTFTLTHMYTHLHIRMHPTHVAVCQLNVHKRCERMVPHNCGINQKELSQALQDMGVSPDKLRPGGKPSSVR